MVRTNSRLKSTRTQGLASCNMSFFDLLVSTPPPQKKPKIGEHGESPQLTPDMKKCEGARPTDVENDAFDSEEEHGPVLKKGGKCAGKTIRKLELCRNSHRARIRTSANLTLERRLEEWGLDKEFTVCGGSSLGCITCMKYSAWHEKEPQAHTMKAKNEKKNATTKAKQAMQKKKPLLMHDDEETQHANMLHQALQEGSFQPEVMMPRRLKYTLDRHLSSSQHKKAKHAAREEAEKAVGENADVPSDAQMMFVYDEVKKKPMAPPPSA